MRALAVVAAGVLTLIGPWAIRNRIAYGRLVLIAPNGSANLAIGNGAEANGGYRALPSFEGGDVEREKHWTTEALRFIEGDPWGALYVTLGRKWQAFWEMIPPWPLYSSNPELFEGEYFFPMPSWRLVFSLGLIGLAPCLRRRGLWIVPASGLAYVLFYMVFFGQARFRMPIEGLFIASAGGAVVSVAALLPRLRRARAAAGGAAGSFRLLVVRGGVDPAPCRARPIVGKRGGGPRVPAIRGIVPSRGRSVSRSAGRRPDQSLHGRSHPCRSGSWPLPQGLL
jgi:hypothetical protein